MWVVVGKFLLWVAGFSVLFSVALVVFLCVVVGLAECRMHGDRAALKERDYWENR